MSSPPEVSPLETATSPQSPNSASMKTTQAQDFAQPSLQPPRVPTMRGSSDGPPVGNVGSPNPLGAVNAARRPAPSMGVSRPGGLPQDVQAKMKAFHLSRTGSSQTNHLQNLRNPAKPSTPGDPNTPHPAPPNPMSGAMAAGAPATNIMGPPGGSLAGGLANLRLPQRPTAQVTSSAPVVPVIGANKKPGGLAAKRGIMGGMKLSEATGPSPSPQTSITPTTGQDTSGQSGGEKDGEVPPASDGPESMFKKYSEYVDTKTGTLKFKGKARIHGKGIDFSSGTSFQISLDEVDTLDELGKGNYGTVYKVRHSRPHFRKLGQGLGGNRTASNLSQLSKSSEDDGSELPTSPPQGNLTGVVMAMKEIRLELDDAKFAAIIMELDILHRCISPFIVDFYGAFFQEGAVYICMEFMDGGSIDKLYGDGIPENVLRKISLSTVMGLKSLKDEHNIIHRDVKPTNILVNSKGQVKICDFGVSGNLVASIAKTNIGCQSYMAPERISGGGVQASGANPGGGTYSVQSDIWSLGLTIIECALGQYPYPPETYDNIFSQLSVGDDPSRPGTQADKHRLSSKGTLLTFRRSPFPKRHTISSGAVSTKSPNYA